MRSPDVVALFGDANVHLDARCGQGARVNVVFLEFRGGPPHGLRRMLSRINDGFVYRDPEEENQRAADDVPVMVRLKGLLRPYRRV